MGIVNEHPAGADERSRLTQILAVVDPGFAFPRDNSLPFANMTFHRKLHGDTRQLCIHRALPISSRNSGGLLTDLLDVLRNFRSRHFEPGKASAKLFLKLIDTDSIQKCPRIETNAQVSLDGSLGKGLRQTLLNDLRAGGLSITDGVDIGSRASHVDYEHIAPTWLIFGPLRTKQRTLKCRHGRR